MEGQNPVKSRGEMNCGGRRVTRKINVQHVQKKKKRGGGTEKHTTNRKEKQMALTCFFMLNSRSPSQTILPCLSSRICTSRRLLAGWSSEGRSRGSSL